MKSLRDIKLEAWHHEMTNGFPEVYVMVSPLRGGQPMPIYMSDLLRVGRGLILVQQLRTGLLFRRTDLRDAWRHHDLRSYYVGNGLAQRYKKLVGSKVKGGQ